MKNESKKKKEIIIEPLKETSFTEVLEKLLNSKKVQKTVKVKLK